MALLKKVKASTLLEPLLAMVTLLTVFGISCIIFSNVLKSDNKSQRFNAYILLHAIADSAKSQHSFIDEIIEKENITIEKKVAKYGSSNNAYILSLRATRDQKVIAETDQIVIDE